MSVWIRRGALALVGLVVLVVGGAAIFVASFDANKYKGVAIDWMKTNRQRTLVIDGPIELSMFPRLALKVSKVTLSEAARPDIFAAIDSAGLAVDVMPLLHGEVVVGRVDAKGVRVTYVRDAKGQSNIDDLLKSEPQQPSTTTAAGKPVRFDVSGIALSDVTAVVKDDMSGTNGQLLLKTFNSGRLSNRVEAPVDMNLQFDFKQPVVKGTLSGDTQLMRCECEGLSAGSKAKPRWRASFRRASRGRCGRSGAARAHRVDALLRAVQGHLPLSARVDRARAGGVALEEQVHLPQGGRLGVGVEHELRVAAQRALDHRLLEVELQVHVHGRLDAVGQSPRVEGLQQQLSVGPAHVVLDDRG